MTRSLLMSFLAGLCGAGSAAPVAATAADDDVLVTVGIAYHDGPDADAARHRLDVYRPRGANRRPVLLLFHGGAWMFGDKQYGQYPEVARCLARQGVVVVMANYRLSPAVRHPEHVRDAARALAWTVKHGAEYGGRPDQVFVCGHSAGGHLAALLAADEAHLKAEGLTRAAIRGVISVSGVYRLLDLSLNVKSDGLMLVSTFAYGDLPWLPQLQIAAELPSFLRGRPALQVDLNPISLVFGSDPDVRRTASPLNHVGPNLPPFLIVHAERDLPTLSATAEEFALALKKCKCPVEVLQVRQRNHRDVLLAATTPEDPVIRAITAFVDQTLARVP